MVVDVVEVHGGVYDVEHEVFGKPGSLTQTKP